jgi:GT2 family glycosyltransferase
MLWAQAMQGKNCPISHSTASVTLPSSIEHGQVANDPTILSSWVGFVPRSMSPTPPFFSIIAQTYRRMHPLSTCLAALAHLDYPHESFEVIIVDDGGQVPLEAVVAPFSARLDVTLLRQPHAGPAAARNTGAARAKGQFLAFTDDDCMPASDWLRALARRFATASDHAVGGRTLNALSNNPYATASQFIVDLVYAYYNADPCQVRFFASNNLALPANRFRALGGFDPTFRTSEDRDLCDRWLHHGYRMISAPEAMVSHAHVLTLRTFWRQHFNYGRGAFRFHRARAQRGSGLFRSDLAFYRHLPDLLRRRFSERRGAPALPLTALLGVWQGANTAGFCWQAVHSRCGLRADVGSERRPLDRPRAFRS